MTTFNLGVLYMNLPIQFAVVNLMSHEFWKAIILGCRQAGCCYLDGCLGKWWGLPTSTGNPERSLQAAESRISSVKFKVQVAF